MAPDRAPRTGTDRPQPGSQHALRDRNERECVQVLRTAGPSTQADLARLTGLSPATVSSIVKVLADRGAVTVEPTTSSGRRALLVRLQQTSQLAAGIDVGRTHVRVAFASPAYEVIAERTVPLPEGHTANEALDAATWLFDELSGEHSVDRSAVIGVGVGIPGPIDPKTSVVIGGSILPEWVDVDVRSLLDARLDLPVHVDNDANLGALAEVTWGPYGRADGLVFVKLGTGIGCGLYLGGELFRGAFGTAGEIGHWSVDEDGRPCRCGNRGCLETVGSTSTIVEALTPSGITSVADVVTHAAAGHTATLRVLEDAGAAVGRALAAVVNLVNPAVILIGGPLSDVGDALLEPMQRSVRRWAIPQAGEATTLAMTSLGERAEVLGAISLVLRHQPA